MSKIYGCPVEFALDILGGKWKPVLLAHLKEGPLGYGELRRRVPALSDKVLTERLKNLEASGLVARVRDPDVGARSRYALSDRGQSLRPVLQAIFDWGMANAGEMDAVISLRIGDDRLK